MKHKVKHKAKHNEPEIVDTIDEMIAGIERRMDELIRASTLHKLDDDPERAFQVICMGLEMRVMCTPDELKSLAQLAAYTLWQRYQTHHADNANVERTVVA